MTQEEKDNLISLSVRTHLEAVRRRTGMTITPETESLFFKEYNKFISDEINAFKTKISAAFKFDSTNRDNRIAEVFRIVGDVFEVDAADIIKKSSKREYVYPRHLVRWLIHRGHAGVKITSEKTHELTIPVGLTGNHTNVIRSCVTVDDLIEYDKEFKERANRVLMLLNPIEESE